MTKYNKAYEALKKLDDEYMERMPEIINGGERSSKLAGDLITWRAIRELMKEVCEDSLNVSNVSERP